MIFAVLGGVHYFLTVFCGLRINITVYNKPEIGYLLLDSSLLTYLLHGAALYRLQESLRLSYEGGLI